MRPPAFWEKSDGLARVLAPFGVLYGRIVTARAMRRGFDPGIPVLCVGNPTLGGSGKTPVVRALVELLQDEFGLRAHVISKGYGGSVRGSLLVDPLRHDAATVGDEPLLMARDATVWVGSDRVASAQQARAAGAQVLVMDDGFQNPGLAKTASWLVVDGPAGFGNGQVFPAGPLRERFADAWRRSDALVVIGDDDLGLAARVDVPVIRADLIHPPEQIVALAESPVFAFAGIGRPGKFVQTLSDAGVRVVGWRGYPDHHPYGARDLQTLRDLARKNGARLVTTEKDIVRFGKGDRTDITAVSVAIRWRNPKLVRELVRGSITQASMR